MGGENSKPENKEDEKAKSMKERLHTEIAIQRALEQQRRIYEKKLLEAQSKSLQQNNVNKSNIPKVTPQTSSNLYPNVQSMTPQRHIVTNNNVKTTVYPSVTQPCVSQAQYQVNQNHVKPQSPSSSTSTTMYPNVHIQTFHVYKSQPPSQPQPRPQPPPQPTPPSQPPPQLQPQSQPLASNNSMQNSPNVNKPFSTFEFQFSPSAPSAPEAPADDVEENQKVPCGGARPKSRTRPQSKKNNETQLVNCVTCSRPLESNIYNCQKGHSSCGNCRTNKKPCGICSSLILDMRNITLEITIAENNMKMENNNEVRLKCSNAVHGCRLTFKKELLESHLKECPFKDLVCPFSKKKSCNWKGKINQLSVHLKEAHPENCEANVDTELTLMNDPSDPYVNEIVHFVPIGSFNFLIHIKRDIQKTIYMTTQLYGTKVSASKWTYELHIYNKKTPRRKFLYTDTCHSDTTSVQDLFDAGQCAVIPIEYVKTYLDNNKLTYKIYLKKDIDSKKKYSQNKQN